MNTPIIDTKCSSCRRPYRGRGEWGLVILAGKLVGITCPRCADVKTPGHASPDQTHMEGTAGFQSLTAEDWIREGHLSSLVHLAGGPEQGLTLHLDQAEISTAEQASELGHTLLVLGQLMTPAGSSQTHDLKEGPGINAS